MEKDWSTELVGKRDKGPFMAKTFLRVTEHDPVRPAVEVIQY